MLCVRDDDVRFCTRLSETVWQKDLLSAALKVRSSLSHLICLSLSHFAMSQHCTKLRNKHLLYIHTVWMDGWMDSKRESENCSFNYYRTDFHLKSEVTQMSSDHHSGHDVRCHTPARRLSILVSTQPQLYCMMHNLSYIFSKDTNSRLCPRFCHIGHINVLCCWRRCKCVRQAAGCLC